MELLDEILKNPETWINAPVLAMVLILTMRNTVSIARIEGYLKGKTKGNGL